VAVSRPLVRLGIKPMPFLKHYIARLLFNEVLNNHQAEFRDVVDDVLMICDRRGQKSRLVHENPHVWLRGQTGHVQGWCPN
jgi:hypothetical protein